MSRIRILPEAVANKIAAGEVVERPASVVKELLENALDAGANSVRIETEVGGKRMIRVIDDGHGMAHDDALLAFERHATSKLRTAEDLLSIATLGFRGEALPSIAAVSRLLLETRDANEAEGTRVEFAGGKLVNVKPAGLPAGTTINVADLFYCMPARRKFLKSDTTELGHIASLVTHYALANPGKQFTLTTPTQEIVNCAPVEKLADRVYQLFGKQALDELVEIAPVSAAFRAAITEPEMEAGEEQRNLRVREPAAGARPVNSARHSRGVPEHIAAECFSGDATLFGDAVRRSGRECAPGKDRGAIPAVAVCARLHARRDSPGADEHAADRQFRGGSSDDGAESGGAAGNVRGGICGTECKFGRAAGDYSTAGRVGSGVRGWFGLCVGSGI